MIKPALVSIIMPSFNASQFISESIRSVISQTHVDWELLIVDGRSPDGTRDIISEFSHSDCRVRLIDNANDDGPGQARNYGLRYAKGDYVAFLDADDLWLPNKLSSQLDFMIRNKYRFSFTRYKTLSPNGVISVASMGGKKSNTYDQYLCRRGIANSTVMLHNSVVTPEMFDSINRAFAEDTLWWLIILRTGVVAHSLDEVLMFYRIVADSRSSNVISNQLSVWLFYRNHLGLPFTKAIFSYLMYLSDVSIRRLVFKVSEKFMRKKALI